MENCARPMCAHRATVAISPESSAGAAAYAIHEPMRTNVSRRTPAWNLALACSLLTACELAEVRTARPGRGEAVPAAASASPGLPPLVPSDRPRPREAAAEARDPTLVEAQATLAGVSELVKVFPLSVEPGPPQPPPGYGMLDLPDYAPGGEDLVVHAVAGFEVVAVYAEPDIESAKVGYLRLGTRLMVTEKQGTKGCPKGWYALPTGGYACASKGLVVDAKRPPYFPKPPQAARLDQPLPYRYAYVKAWNSPMWWRIPTPEEQKQASALRSQREAARESGAATGTTATAAAGATALLPAPGGDEASKPTAVAVEPAAAAAVPVPMPSPLALPLNPENPWLEKGFFISLGEKVTENGKDWWYTARGGYVEADAAYVYATKDFSGVELGREASFPFGFVMTEEATLFEIDELGGLRSVGSLPRRTFVDLSEEFEVGGKAYMMTAAGQLLRKSTLRLAEPQPVPEGVEPWERWIDVSLSKQMLVAYEGSRPVYVTLVSTGKKGSKTEPFDTPPGRYRIRSKHVSTTMDGNTASDGNYSIQDVPWAMFFEGSYALHGAFWHDGFGRVRSHGCVNLGPTDARWLFQWTTPFLPEGWHGVHAHDGSPGSTVIVRE